MTLQRIKLRLVKSYVSLVLFFYYKNIRVKGLEHMHENRPLLLLSNHQNGLLDPLLIATQTKRYCYYLTRAGVFKKPWVSKLLRGLHLIPVYRVRDGWENLSNNTAVFETCAALLSSGEALVIFPEGSHDLRRQVRPLSKGFTRLLTETGLKYPDLRLELVPVGVNYRNPEAYGDSALLNIGTPIHIQNFAEIDGHGAVKALKQKVHNELQQLTTHITGNYEAQLHTLELEAVDFLNPEVVNHYLKTEEKLAGLELPVNAFLTLKTILKLMLCFCLFPPYFIWKYLVQPKIKEAEFTGTFRFALAATLVPLWLLLLVLFIGLVFSWSLGVLVFVSILALALITVKI